MNISQAVILTGGLGERLFPLTRTVNKGMVPVRGKPFLHHLIDQVLAAGIRDVLFLVGHNSQSVTDYFGDGSRFGMTITYDLQPANVNHGKRLELAISKMHASFLLLKNDIYWPINFREHLSRFLQLKRPVMMTVYRNHKADGIYGHLNNISMQDGLVTAYDSLSDSVKYIGQDLGYVICSKKCFEENFPPGNFSLHNEGLLGDLAAKGLLSGFLTDVAGTTITDVNWLARAEAYFRARDL